ncbi:MAG: TOBE domain-containing protein [Oceanidesulfovibrio sp.]
MISIESMDQDALLALRERIDEALSGRAGGPSAPLPKEHICRLFTVAEGVLWLDRRQLEKLTRAFAAWVAAARDARTKRSRERIFIAYLVLRYTGAKLGEVLALNEREHFDYIRGVVCLPDSPEPREIPLPMEVVEQIRDYCAKYGVFEEGGALFDLDPGFLRRKFYEQSERSRLPKSHLNPRVLRNSRAIELLQGGMPMRAVQSLLGHGKTDLTSSYVKLADTDLRRIINHHCSKEFTVETSARNTFIGEVAHLATNDVICEVTLRTASGYEVVAVITNHSRRKLELAEGAKVAALVKAPWVILERADGPSVSSARNAFPGTIASVKTDGVMAEVNGELDDGTPVCALVTDSSLERLGIGKGDRFLFTFKAMSVILS